jgi:hypothetical protein
VLHPGHLNGLCATMLVRRDTPVSRQCHDALPEVAREGSIHVGVLAAEVLVHLPQDSKAMG